MLRLVSLSLLYSIYDLAYSVVTSTKQRAHATRVRDSAQRGRALLLSLPRGGWRLDVSSVLVTKTAPVLIFQITPSIFIIDRIWARSGLDREVGEYGQAWLELEAYHLGSFVGLLIFSVHLLIDVSDYSYNPVY